MQSSFVLVYTEAAYRITLSGYFQVLIVNFGSYPDFVLGGCTVFELPPATRTELSPVNITFFQLLEVPS